MGSSVHVTAHFPVAMCRVEKPTHTRRCRAPASASASASASGSITTSSQSQSSLLAAREPTSFSVAKMMREEAERVHLALHAEQLESASEGERRRVRREAREQGRAAYARALERTVATNESESSTLQALLAACTQDRLQLSNTLRLVKLNAHARAHAHAFGHAHTHLAQ